MYVRTYVKKITYLSIRKSLLKGIHYFVHFNLCLALFLAMLVFVSGIQTANDNDVSFVVIVKIMMFRKIFIVMHISMYNNTRYIVIIIDSSYIN